MSRKKNEGTETASTETNGDIKESKADRFRRLANARLAKAEKALASVANLASKASYEYTDAQRDTVLRVINDAVGKIEAAFASGKATASNAASYV